MIKIADLFCGIGGFRLGIERAAKKHNVQVECVFSSEIEKNAVKIYEKNFQETPNGDITKINADDIPDMDILCGGFPCQAFSIAGNRRGFEDTRGTLFFDIARIAKEKRPKMLFLENVKGLLNHGRGRTFAAILVALDDIGYDVEWQVCNSKDFGVPQNRERVYFIGHLRGSRTRQIFPVFGETGATTREDSSTCLAANYWKGLDQHGQRTGIICYPVMSPDILKKSQNGRRIKGAEEPMYTLTASDKRGVLIQYYCGDHQQDRVLDPGGISSCLPTGTGGDLMPKFVVSNYSYVSDCFINTIEPSHIEYEDSSLIVISNGRRFEKETLDDGTLGNWREVTYSAIRRLTPTECERLQGFPDGWTDHGISDSMRYHCLGNAVTVNVIEAIAEKILSNLCETQKMNIIEHRSTDAVLNIR